MKKYVSMLLSVIMILSVSYTKASDNDITLTTINYLPKPIGGIATDTNPIYDSDIIPDLDEITKMSDFEKYLYDATYEQKASIDVYSFKLSSTGFADWYLEFASKNPELFLIDKGYSITKKNGYISTISPSYPIKKTNREAFTQVLNQKLDEYYNLTKDEPDPIKKYLLIHSKMIRESHYDYSYDLNPEAHTAYSFFVNGAATCQGYASALLLIADKVGFEATCCFNRNPQVSHIWNYIKINNNWYHTDVTWDDYSAPIDNFTYNNENNQGAVYANFLCSEEMFVSNGHGNKSDYITFEDKHPLCTDKTYESDKWAFNLKSASGAFYLLDFDYNKDNKLFFKLISAKDSEGNPFEFVTNNLWGNDAYVTTPKIGTSSVKYYIFSKKDIPSAKMRLVLKNGNKTTSIVSNDIYNKNKFTLFAAYVYPSNEMISDINQMSMYLWDKLTPLAEKNTYTVPSQSPNE